jgi:hypothetical protein
MSIEMGRTRGLLGGTMTKLKNLMEGGFTTRHMCYLVAAIVVLFLIFYYAFAKR